MKIVGVNINCLTEENKKRFFVYGIKNKITNKYYVGSCTNNRGIVDRFRRHIYHLRLGNHHSIKFQNSFNYYNKGFDCWEFILFEEISKENYKSREQYYLDKYNAYHNGYNSIPIVGYINHGEMSPEHKMALSKSKQNFSELDVIDVFSKYNEGFNYVEISNHYNVSPSTISKTINKSHYYSDIKKKHNLVKTWYSYVFYNKKENKFYRVDKFTNFCKKNGLNHKMMMPLMLKKFKMTFIDDWTVFKKQEFLLSELRNRIAIDDYKHVLYKDEIKYEFKNVRLFCKENKLDETSIYYVLKGEKKSVKGFTT